MKRDSVELAFEEAEFFEAQKDLPEAEQIYDDLASWNKDDVYILIRWEQFLMRQGRVGEAKSLFSSSIDIFSGASLAIFLDQMTSFYTKVLGDNDTMLPLYKKKVESSLKFNKHLILGYLHLLINTEKKKGDNLPSIIDLFDVVVPRMKEVKLLSSSMIQSFFSRF